MLNDVKRDDEARDDWALAIAFGLILGALAGAALFNFTDAPEEHATANAATNTQFLDP